MLESPEDRALSLVASCSDPEKLSRLAENARASGASKVEHAALLKLYSVMPSARPGTFEHDVWQSIHALEGALKRERGKTTLLARTRQKIARDGELQSVADLVTGKESAGFQMLIDRGMPELTFEAVALRHPQQFGQGVLDAARKRLEQTRSQSSTTG
ncbi:hypothetical protein [Parafrankia sp. BMG5.11]|uniref:hypothetical protein n=1 Tax=Parafrankia sp. BMG5.11 TaxID=222540 RepID=UPI0010407DD7|nr:hypothetical protein [Parafrankia sp. BMG5.11]TCJ41272.1 hypothetical protein E0504_01270 [Parafrankia sp. BMG5.11]